MLIYLDMCAIQRPLDDQTQVRVRLEAAAVLGLLDHCRAGGSVLVSSAALAFEAAQNPYPLRRAHAEAVLVAATAFQPLTPAVEARAAGLVGTGVAPLDALHVASAEAVGADYFCTCDDRLLRRVRAAVAAPSRAVSPLELAAELNL